MADPNATIPRTRPGDAPLPAIAGCALAFAPDATRLVLRGAAPALAAGTNAFGTTVPDRLRAVTNEERSALWLGPDELLLIAPRDDSETLRRSLAASLEGLPHALVDITHRDTGVVLEGRPVPRLISAGCPLDLRPTAFPVGMVARTIFAKSQIFLWRQAETRFRIEMGRSFAPYILGYLREVIAAVS